MKLKTPVLYALDLAAGAVGGYLLTFVFVAAHGALHPAWDRSATILQVAGMLAFALIPAGAGALAFCRWRFHPPAWSPFVTLACVSVAAAYLRLDEPVPEGRFAHAKSLLRAAPPDASTAALEALYRGSPGARVRELEREGRFRAYSRGYPTPYLTERKSEPHRRRLEENAEAIRHDFDRALIGREIVQELATFDRIVAPPEDPQDRVRLSGYAAYHVFATHLFFADLIALEGDGDRGAEIALRLLKIADAVSANSGHADNYFFFDLKVKALTSLRWTVTVGSVSPGTAALIRRQLENWVDPVDAAVRDAANVVLSTACDPRLGQGGTGLGAARSDGVFSGVTDPLGAVVLPLLIKPGRTLRGYLRSFDDVVRASETGGLAGIANRYDMVRKASRSGGIDFTNVLGSTDFDRDAPLFVAANRSYQAIRRDGLRSQILQALAAAE